MYGVGFGYGSAGATTILKSGGAFDADAQSFFAASGVTDVAQKNAINTYILDLKSNSLWSKFKEIHFYFLGDSTKNSYNVKNPSTFTNVFSSGWTFSSSGATPNGTSAYCESGLNISTVMSANSVSAGFYFGTAPTKTSSANGIFISGSIANCLYRSNATANFTYWNGVEIGLNTSSGADNNGFQQVSRHNTTQSIRKHKSNSVTTHTDAYTSLPNAVFHKGKANGLNVYEDRRFTLTYVADGLTSSELDTNYTITQALMTTLGINV